MPIQLLPTAINFLGKQLSKTVGKKAFTNSPLYKDVSDCHNQRID